MALYYTGTSNEGYRAGSNLLPLAEWLPVLKKAKRIADAEGAVLIGSGDGHDVDSSVEMVKRMKDIRLEIVEINVGCELCFSLCPVDAISMVEI